MSGLRSVNLLSNEYMMMMMMMVIGTQSIGSIILPKEYVQIRVCYNMYMDTCTHTNVNVNVNWTKVKVNVRKLATALPPRVTHEPRNALPSGN